MNESVRAPADWLGAVFLGTGLALLVLALYPDDPRHNPVGRYFIPAGIGALVALAAWAHRQLAVLSPVIPRELLRSRQFLGSSFANLLVGGGLMVALVDIPILGRGVFNLDQLGSSLLLARVIIAVPPGAAARWPLASWPGPRRRADSAPRGLRGCVYPTRDPSCPNSQRDRKARSP